MSDRLENQLDYAYNRLQAAHERIEKLEAALRRISDDGNWGPDGCWDAASYPDEIALAALGEKKDG